MIPILFNIEKYNTIYKTKLEKEVYKKDINSFIENSGVTIQNINFPINGFYISLKEISTSFSCGNIIENLFEELKQIDINSNLIIIDFDEVEELSNNFYKSYTKTLLETSNKIITINMNTSLSNEFSNFIKSNIIDMSYELFEDVEE